MKENTKNFAQVREFLRDNQMWNAVVDAFDAGIGSGFKSVKDAYEQLGASFLTVIIPTWIYLESPDKWDSITEKVVKFCSEAPTYTYKEDEILVCKVKDVPASVCIVDLLGMVKAKHPEVMHITPSKDEAHTFLCYKPGNPHLE